MRETSVGAVMVTFEPGPSVVENIRAIAQQVEQLVVVDNGSANRESWAREVDLGNVEIVALGDNFGVAHALNVGITQIDAAHGWIATFDQDTLLQPNYFAELLDQGEAGQDEAVGMVVPGFGGLPGEQGCERASTRRVLTAISSGSVIRRAVLGRVGLFDDALFIDYVDHDFCLRMARANLKVIEVTGVRLNHRLGEMTAHSLLGRQVLTSHHSPVRRYYMFRNRLQVYRRHAARFPLWFARDLARNLTEIAKVLLWEGDKKRKLRFMGQGTLDGLAGRLGKYRETK